MMKKITWIMLAVLIVAALLIVSPLSAALIPKGSSFKGQYGSMLKANTTPKPSPTITPVSTMTPKVTKTPSFRDRFGGVLKPNSTQKAVMPQVTGPITMPVVTLMPTTNLNNIWNGQIPGSEFWGMNLVGGPMPDSSGTSGLPMW